MQIKLKPYTIIAVWRAFTASSPIKMLRLRISAKSNDYMEWWRWLQQFILETTMERNMTRPRFPSGLNMRKGIQDHEAVEELMRYELKTMGQHWYDDYITYAICFPNGATA